MTVLKQPRCIIAVDPDTQHESIIRIERNKKGRGYVTQFLCFDDLMGYEQDFSELDCIVVENQYIGKSATHYQQSCVIELAHHAGKFLAAGSRLGVPVYYVYPGDWMRSLLGVWTARGKDRDKMVRFYVDGTLGSEDTNRDDWSLHDIDAAAIGLYWFTTGWTRAGMKNHMGKRWTKKSIRESGRAV